MKFDFVYVIRVHFIVAAREYLFFGGNTKNNLCVGAYVPFD